MKIIALLPMFVLLCGCSRSSKPAEGKYVLPQAILDEIGPESCAALPTPPKGTGDSCVAGDTSRSVAVSHNRAGGADLFMYGFGAGQDITTGTCDIFIGTNAGKGVTSTSYELVISGDFNAATLVDIEYWLNRSQRNYYEERTKQCSDLYDKAYWKIDDMRHDAQLKEAK